MLEHRADLRVERRSGKVSGMSVTQRRPGTMIGICHRKLQWIGMIAACSRGVQVVPAASSEVGRCLTDKWGADKGKVCRIVPGETCVGFIEVGANQLGM